jgi:hypothetical protein
MTSKVAIPEVLPISPISLPCPYCKAKPGKDCATSSGGLAVLHLSRIKAAAMDLKKKKTLEKDLAVSARA